MSLLLFHFLFSYFQYLDLGQDCRLSPFSSSTVGAFTAFCSSFRDWGFLGGVGARVSFRLGSGAQINELVSLHDQRKREHRQASNGVLGIQGAILGRCRARHTFLAMADWDGDGAFWRADLVTAARRYRETAEHQVTGTQDGDSYCWESRICYLAITECTIRASTCWALVDTVKLSDWDYGRGKQERVFFLGSVIMVE